MRKFYTNPNPIVMGFDGTLNTFIEIGLEIEWERLCTEKAYENKCKKHPYSIWSKNKKNKLYHLHIMSEIFRASCHFLGITEIVEKYAEKKADADQPPIVDIFRGIVIPQIAETGQVLPKFKMPKEMEEVFNHVG